MAETPLEIMKTYADGARVLLAPPGALGGERGGRGPVSYDELGAQAERLSEVSARATEEAAAALGAAAEPEARAQVSTQLLAKALTDLEISAVLFEAAQDEEARVLLAKGGPVERSAPSGRRDEETLALLTGAAPPAAAERGRRTLGGVEDARRQLSETVDDVLQLISDRASRVGQSALAGLFGVGLAEVGAAAGKLGLGVAEAFGQAENLSRLYTYVREFVHHAYESVVALLGQGIAQQVGGMVVKWMDEVKEAKFFGRLVERLYQTRQTKEALAQKIAASQAPLDAYADTIGRLELLNQEYARQVGLIEKLLQGLKYLGGIPAAVLPYGSLIMAAVYLSLCGYTVLAGADYVDADALSLLNRVRGVRELTEAGI